MCLGVEMVFLAPLDCVGGEKVIAHSSLAFVVVLKKRIFSPDRILIKRFNAIFGGMVAVHHIISTADSEIFENFQF